MSCPSSSLALSRLSGYVHPGMYQEKKTQEELNASVISAFKQLLKKQLPKVQFNSIFNRVQKMNPTLSNENAFRNTLQILQKQFPEVASIEKQANIKVTQQITRPFDGDIRDASYLDRLLYEKSLPLLEELENTFGTPFLEFPEINFHICLQYLNHALFPDNHPKRLDIIGPKTLSRPVTTFYRKDPTVIVKIDAVDFFADLKCYLEKNDPSSVSTFLSVCNKIQTAREASFSANETAFVDKYLLIYPSPHLVENLMITFIRELRQKILALEDPIHIAAFAHMGIVNIHPFNDGNGRTARAFMNFILLKFNQWPLSFPYSNPYTQAVRNDKDHPGTFETFLRKESNSHCTPEDLAFAKAMDGKTPEQITDLFDRFFLLQRVFESQKK